MSDDMSDDMSDANLRPRVAAADRLRDNPTRENYEACVAVITAQRMEGKVTHESYLNRLHRFATDYPELHKGT